MRLSRPCYNKPHRCPGYAGGGMKYAKVVRCDGGFIWTDHGVRGLKFHQCSGCGVITWPYAIRWVDPAWLHYKLRSWWLNRHY